KKIATDHSMYTDLVDDKGRVRASIFYKAAFYDRKADISFKRRFSIRVVTSLPEEELGRWEERTVLVPNPNYREDESFFVDDTLSHVRHSGQKEYIKEKQRVFIRKYKDIYEERNAAP